MTAQSALPAGEISGLTAGLPEGMVAALPISSASGDQTDDDDNMVEQDPSGTWPLRGRGWVENACGLLSTSIEIQSECLTMLPTPWRREVLPVCQSSGIGEIQAGVPRL